MLSYLALAAFSLFLFSGAGDLEHFHGDDIHFMTRNFHYQNDYLSIMRYRGFLNLFYTQIYEALGSSIPATHAFFLGLHVLGGFLFHAILKRLLDPVSALTGACFFLAYIGREETVTWISAGGYLMVMAVFLTSILIAMSGKLSPWRKAVLITLLNWLAVHLYEFLIVAAPLYPLILAAEAQLAGRKLKRRILIPSLLPTVMFLGHWALMYISLEPGHSPAWARIPENTAHLGAIASSLVNSIWLGLIESCGIEHIYALRRGWAAFYFMPKATSTVAVAVLAAALILLFMLSNRASKKMPDTTSLILFMGAALYLAVLSPAVGFSIVGTVVPQRLLSLPAAGYAALFAVAFALMLNRLPLSFKAPLLFRAAVGAVLLFHLALEATGMQTALRAEDLNWRYTKNLRAQFNAFGLTPGVEDRVFFSLPALHPVFGMRRFGVFRYENVEANLIFLIDRNMVRLFGTLPPGDRLRYFWETRWDQSRHKGLGMPRQDLDDPSRIFPMHVDDAYRMRAIRRAEFIDAAGRITRTVEFPRVAHLPAGATIVLRATDGSQ
jgi:hypothetical protein